MKYRIIYPYKKQETETETRVWLETRNGELLLMYNTGNLDLTLLEITKHGTLTRNQLPDDTIFENEKTSKEVPVIKDETTKLICPDHKKDKVCVWYENYCDDKPCSKHQR